MSHIRGVTKASVDSAEESTYAWECHFTTRFHWWAAHHPAIWPWRCQLEEAEWRHTRRRALCKSPRESKPCWGSSCYNELQVWALFWEPLKFSASEDIPATPVPCTLKMASLGPSSQALFCKQHENPHASFLKNLDTVISFHFCSVQPVVSELDPCVWWCAVCMHLLLGTKHHSMQISFLLFKDAF